MNSQGVAVSGPRIKGVIAAVIGVLLAWWAFRDQTSATQPAAATPPPAAIATRDAARPSAASAAPPSASERRPAARPPAAVAAAAEPDDTGQAAQPSAEVVARLSLVNGTPLEETALVWSSDCRLRSWGRDTERVFHTTASRCTFQARRRDGLLQVWTDPVTVDLDPGERASVNLLFPVERTGGLGIQFRPVDEGIEVLYVIPGSPAEEEGLQPGDVIVSVDGLPTSALETDEFVQVMTGPEGTEVVFVLAYEDDTGAVEEEVTITRAVLD